MRVVQVLLVVGIGLLGLRPSPAQAQSYQGTVYEVVDGDTIHLLDETGQIIRIPLYGIDAPERGQPYGNAATQALRRLVFRRRVRAVAEDWDEDGRPFFVVSLDDQVLNEAMLRRGLAWWDRVHAARDEHFRRLEAEARTAKRGLWAQSDPTPPWEWRRQNTRP